MRRTGPQGKDAQHCIYMRPRKGTREGEQSGARGTGTGEGKTTPLIGDVSAYGEGHEGRTKRGGQRGEGK